MEHEDSMAKGHTYAGSRGPGGDWDAPQGSRDLNMCSMFKKVEVRRGTRVPCEIPIVLIGLVPACTFFEACLVILANPQGCAVRSRRPLEVGATVRLDGLPAKTAVTARVVMCISMGDDRELWLLGLALDEPAMSGVLNHPPKIGPP